MTRGLLLCGLVSCALACGGQTPLPAPARFDRPNRVDFVCVQTLANGDTVPIQLSTCRGDVATDNGIALHALVTQSARGEVAAVNLETRTVIDNRRDIPGYSFVPVGDLPTGLVVAPHHPEITYVADYGSSDVRVLDTSSIIGPLIGTPEVQIVQPSIDAGDGPVPARPVDMVLSPTEDALLLPVPELGRVLWLPLERCNSSRFDCHEGRIDEAGIASIDLRGSVDRLVATTADGQSTPRYEELCGFERPEPPPPSAIPIPPSDQLSATPRPAALAVDAFCRSDQVDCQRHLLVADEALPLIHSIDLDAIVPGSSGTDALLAPLLAGVPTKDVVVTPHVPVTPESPDETQYVYAIDATDGSVLALENGQVLNVSSDPATRHDRIELSGAGTISLGAAKLAILTPDFDVTGPGNQYVLGSDYVPPVPDMHPATVEQLCTDADVHPLEDPARLRGVFLAAALTDGTVGVFDVHDMELRPGGNTKASCRTCATPARIPVLERHHARLNVNFISTTDTQAPAFAPTSAPYFAVSGAQFLLRTDGTHGSPDAPSLDCLSCDSDLVQSFPPLDEVAADTSGTLLAPGCEKKPAIVCGSADPWNSNDEQWNAQFEGQIPGTRSVAILPSSTTADGNVRTIGMKVDLCELGVLGSQDLGAEHDAEGCAKQKTLPGDQLVILEAISSDPNAVKYKARKGFGDRERQACVDAGKAIEDSRSQTLAIAFNIIQAFGDHVVIDATRLATPIAGLTNYESVLRCLDPGPKSIEVRTRESFTVVGNNAGFLHRVKARSDGRCVFDPDTDPLLRGRAWAGCPFRNRTTAFSIQPSENQSLPGATLIVYGPTPATKVALNANLSSFTNLTIVPVQLRYSDTDQRMYLVDISDRGLVPVVLSPFPTTVDPTQSFN